MGEYGESEKLPESVFDLALGHSRISVKTKDAGQLGLEDRGKLRCGNNFNFEVFGIRWRLFNVEEVSG